MIRQLTKEDKQQWTRLWRGYQDYYEVDLTSGEDDLFARLLNPPKEGPFCLVYEEEGKLLGLAQYLFHAMTWSLAPRCYLNDLYTLPESRGKGVGEQLLRAVAQAAKQGGASQYYWLTQDFNHGARKLYDKVGNVTPFIKYTMDVE